MGNKRKNNDSINGNSDKRVKQEHVETNGLADLTINEGKFKVFLIKKPIKVTLEDLQGLTWTDDEEVLSKAKLKTEIGAFRAIVAPNAKKERMVHIPAIREREDSDSKNIKANCFVHGSITILPQEWKQKRLGGSIYEEGEEPSGESAVIHPGLCKIKKTAILDLETRKQRNKAYGTTTDCSGEPRKLINILKK